MGRMSKTKGKVGEREVAALLREAGFKDAKRGVQFQGGKDSPDVVGLPGWHIEVKRTEALALYPALDQAVADADWDKVPVVFHRKNKRQWVAIIDAKNFLQLVKKVVDAELEKA